MTVNPIPNNLLGDEFYLCVPTNTGWDETLIENVRVERKSSASGPTDASIRDNSELTIWYDYTNSSPEADFAAGARARYYGEIFEITEVKFFRAQELHHCRIKAVKTGGKRTDINL
ncbi:MAG TPA: hypothetical protein DER68_03240 [Ruminococcaceae bacterium]|nr:hypothetical protein [Oscillospiraceae bacterium]